MASIAIARVSGSVVVAPARCVTLRVRDKVAGRRAADDSAASDRAVVPRRDSGQVIRSGTDPGPVRITPVDAPDSIAASAAAAVVRAAASADDNPPRLRLSSFVAGRGIRLR